MHVIKPMFWRFNLFLVGVPETIVLIKQDHEVHYNFLCSLYCNKIVKCILSVLFSCCYSNSQRDCKRYKCARSCNKHEMYWQFCVHVYCSAMNKSGTGPIEHATFLRIENENNQLVLIRKIWKHKIIGISAVKFSLTKVS